MSFLILRLFILKYHLSLGIVNCPQDEDICITIKIQTMHSFYLSWDRNQFRFPILPWQPEPVPLFYTFLVTGTSSAFLHFLGNRNQFCFPTFPAQPEPVPLSYFPGDRNQFRFPTFPAQPEPVPLSYTSLATGTSSAFPLSWRPEPVPLSYFPGTTGTSSVFLHFSGDRN